jgi:hypothetical protein
MWQWPLQLIRRLTQLAGSSVANLDAGGEFRDQFFVFHAGDIVGCHWRAEDDRDSVEPWCFCLPRPALVGSIDGNRLQSGRTAASQRTESWLQPAKVPVRCPSSLGEYEHHFVSAQTTDGLLDALDAHSISINRDGVEEVNQMPEERMTEQRLPGQVV